MVSVYSSGMLLIVLVISFIVMWGDLLDLFVVRFV